MTAATYIADGAPAPIEAWRWKNSALPAIHMPRNVCRLELLLQAIRVERLHEISEADAIAEGTTCWVCGGRVDGLSENDCECFHTKAAARPSYEVLWRSLHGEESWSQNPLVWVLTFTVAQRVMAKSERPILFSAPMVLALLAGRKTQTRRTSGLEGVSRGRPVRYTTEKGRWGATFELPGEIGLFFVPCPYGKAGDRLWVREGVRRTA